MTDRSDHGSTNAAEKTPSPHLRPDQLHREKKRPGRADTLDEDLDAERLEPGLRTGGEGETGADPAATPSDGNSNT